MPTVIFYCSILLFSTLFIYLREKGKGKLEYYFFTTIAFLLVFVPSAIRYDVGTDYLSYKNVYFNLDYFTDMEPGFYYVNYFLKSLGFDAQWMFAIIAFIFTAVSFSAYPKKYTWVFHFSLICVLWYMSFNIMRQTTALSFCLLAVMSYFNNKYTYFFLLAFIGCLFHTSAVFILFVGLGSLIPLSMNLKSIIMPKIFIGGIIFTYISSTLIMAYIEQILNLVGMARYAAYFNNSKHFVELDFGSGVGVLVKVLFTCYVIFRSKVFLWENKNYWLLIVLCFCYGVGLILANNIIIFGRMADLFSIALVLGFYFLYRYDSKKMMTKIVIGIFGVYLMLSFIKMGFGEETSYTNPKRNPYVTIFSN